MIFFQTVMDHWAVGQKEKINDNSNFYLEFERLKGCQISKRFNAKNYKFKVSLKQKIKRYCY